MKRLRSSYLLKLLCLFIQACIIQSLNNEIFGQSKNIGPSIYYNSLNEVGIGSIYTTIGRRDALELSVGYSIPFSSGMSYESSLFGLTNITSPFLSLAQSGVIFRLTNTFSFSPQKNSFLGFGIEYSILESNKYISDPGKNSGSNTSNYKEFKDDLNVFGFGLKYLNRISEGDDMFISMGTGIKFKSIDRHYSVEGTYSNQIPSDRTEKLSKNSVYFNVGVVYYWLRRK